MICLPAKNVTLAGVKSLIIQDHRVSQISDLSTQFFIREEDVKAGKTRFVTRTENEIKLAKARLVLQKENWLLIVALMPSMWIFRSRAPFIHRNITEWYFLKKLILLVYNALILNQLLDFWVCEWSSVGNPCIIFEAERVFPSWVKVLGTMCSLCTLYPSPC